jgi:long-chain acyl-CoA synthetase
MPTVFVAVPRVYEKIYSQVEQKAKGFAQRKIYQWALSVGRSHSAKILAGDVPSSLAWRLAHRLVYSQLRARMGRKVQIFVSGGAPPLGKELAAWYASMGIRIREGYGLTETSPVIAINPRAHKLGTVGRPLVPDEFTAADRTLTPTMKLRRKAIEERYREQIDDLYKEAETTSVA